MKAERITDNGFQTESQLFVESYQEQVRYIRDAVTGSFEILKESEIVSIENLILEYFKK